MLELGHIVQVALHWGCPFVMTKSISSNGGWVIFDGLPRRWGLYLHSLYEIPFLKMKILFFGGRGMVLGFNSVPHSCQVGILPLEPLCQPFFVFRYFRDRVSRSICPGWLQNAIPLISAIWVARITSVSHQHEVKIKVLKGYMNSVLLLNLLKIFQRL
jgi:hypothetical protein